MTNIRLSGSDVMRAANALQSAAEMLREVAAGWEFTRAQKLLDRAFASEYAAKILMRPFERETVAVSPVAALADAEP